MDKDDIRRGLAAEARLVSERIPTEMSKEKLATIQAKLRDFLAVHEMSQNHFAEKIGVSGAQISQFLGSGYKGDIRNLASKVVEYMNVVDRSERRARGEAFVETEIAKRIYDTIRNVEAYSLRRSGEGAIGLIVGDSGHGKTTCLKEYAKASKHAVYVKLDSSMSTRGMFAAIADACRIESYGVTGTIAARLIEGLNTRHLVVILDEASWLRPHHLSLLREIICGDDKCGCPLILAGNAALLRTIMMPSTRHGHEALDQVRSRMFAVCDLNAESSQKGGGLYTAADIRKLYEYGGLKLSGDAVAALRQICMTAESGRLGTCSVIIDVLHISGGDHKDKGIITAATIRQTIASLKLIVRSRISVAVEESQTEGDEAVAAAG